MPDWRRSIIPGGTFFFTVVTDQRRPVFISSHARNLLGCVMRECQATRPFNNIAIVLLPDHLHAIWSLPDCDADYSARWQWIKTQFTKRWLAAGGMECQISQGRRNDGRRGVWQPKFWEHTIENEVDFEHHFDYIHYNPVKHGYCDCPVEWRWSSFHRWVHRGIYAADWACADYEPKPNFDSIANKVGE